MRMYKGVELTGLAFLIIIASIILAAFVIIIETSNIGLKINVNSKVNFLIETSNIGSGLVSFIRAEKEGVSVAETIGMLDADNINDEILNKMAEYVGIRFTVMVGDKEIKKYGEPKQTVIEADVAMTGGRRGRIEIS